MKTLGIFVCLLVGLSSANSLSGQALHPLYKDKTEEVFEPALLGTWVSCAGAAFPFCVGLQFERSPDGGYRVSSPVEETPKIDLVYAFHLVRLGDALFGDLKLTDIVVADRSLGGDLQCCMTQVHTIFRVSFKGGKLLTSGFDLKRAETQKALAENGIQLHLESLDDGSLLALAPTADLQHFARKMASDKRVFSDLDEWERYEKDQGDGKKESRGRHLRFLPVRPA